MGGEELSAPVPAPQHPPPAEELHRVSTGCSFSEREGVEQAPLPGSEQGTCSNPRPSRGEIKPGGQQPRLVGGQVAPDNAELTASCMPSTVKSKTPRNHPQIHPQRNGILAICTKNRSSRVQLPTLNEQTSHITSAGCTTCSACPV